MLFTFVRRVDVLTDGQTVVQHHCRPGRRVDGANGLPPHSGATVGQTQVVDRLGIFCEKRTLYL